MAASPIVDSLQYAAWSKKVFRQMRKGGVSAVHATVAYHGSFEEMAREIDAWDRRFREHSDLIFPGRTGDDVRRAAEEGRTAIFFGIQNPSPIGDDLGLIRACHDLGVRFMQLTYNNQSLLATGCMEKNDGGLTHFGHEAIDEMNRVGMVIDLSHCAEASAHEAILYSSRPVAITHANPSAWHDCPRNLADWVLGRLADEGGMIGLSLYPHHLKGGSSCALEDFCSMAAEAVRRYGSEAIGIGSDLCQDRPDSALEWMRYGRWSRDDRIGDPAPSFPERPQWFRDNRDFPGIAEGLGRAGLSDEEVDGVMGGNWLRFFDHAFLPEEE